MVEVLKIIFGSGSARVAVCICSVALTYYGVHYLVQIVEAIGNVLLSILNKPTLIGSGQSVIENPLVAIVAIVIAFLVYTIDMFMGHRERMVEKRMLDANSLLRKLARENALLLDGDSVTFTGITREEMDIVSMIVEHHLEEEERRGQ